MVKLENKCLQKTTNSCDVYQISCEGKETWHLIYAFHSAPLLISESTVKASSLLAKLYFSSQLRLLPPSKADIENRQFDLTRSL